MMWFMGRSYIWLCYVPVRCLTDRRLPGRNWGSCLYLFAHVTTRALPGLDCRGCTCEPLCQRDKRFFFHTGKVDTGERRDEEVMFRCRCMKGYCSSLSHSACMSDQLCRCRALRWLISGTEHLCVAFVAINFLTLSQNNPPSCQINLSKDLEQSTLHYGQKMER